MVVVKQRTMNSFLRVNPWFEAMDPVESKYKKGDFIAHVTGMSAVLRISLFHSRLHLNKEGLPRGGLLSTSVAKHEREEDAAATDAREQEENVAARGSLIHAAVAAAEGDYTQLDAILLAASDGRRHPGSKQLSMIVSK